jgi:hypothetical protein
MTSLSHSWRCNVPGRTLTLPGKNSMIQTLAKTPRKLHCDCYRLSILVIQRYAVREWFQ